MQFHPLANIFPLLEGDEHDALTEDIMLHGQHEPIVLYQDMILDGRNRYRACVRLGVPPVFEEYRGDDPLAYVISLNLRRRHLDESQRAMIADKVATMRQGERTDLEPSANLRKVSQQDAAKLLNVSERSITNAATVRREGVPELQRAVETGVASVSAAADLTELPPLEQARIVGLGEKAILDAAKEIRSRRADQKRITRNATLVELSNWNAPLPDRRYPIILADPPWRYDFSPSNDRSVENHYPTMEIEAICALGVEAICTPDAMLFLWAPPSFIEKGLQVLHAWGFELASSAVWVKPSVGTGIYVRQRHEYLLLGKRGQPITPRPGDQPDSVIEAPRGAHSEKPDAVYQIIEQMDPGLPRLELFARGPARQGWNVWGNQANAVARLWHVIRARRPEIAGASAALHAGGRGDIRMCNDNCDGWLATIRLSGL